MPRPESAPLSSATPFPLQGWQSVVGGVVLALAYFLTARLGLSLATISENVTLIWPPSGLALFALLTFGVRLWPWIAFGALATNLSTGLDMAAALAIAGGNTLEALAGCYLLRMVGFDCSFRRVRDVVYLAILAAGVSTVISATLGTAALVGSDVIPAERFSLVWLNWWLGDAMGDLVFASFLLAWVQKGPVIRDARRLFEIGVLGALLVGFAYLALSGHLTHAGKPLPIAFLLLPLMMWATLRFEMRGATTAIMIVCVVSLLAINQGNSLFGHAGSFDSMLLLWLYINVNALTVMVLAASVSERHLAETQLRHLAQHDALTGLPGRAVLADRITQAVRHAERHACHAAVLFVDIDRFKVINDTLGHSAGDAFVVQVAHRLRAALRAKDTVTRQGGDEFIIVLDDIAHAEAAARVAQTVLDTLSAPFVVHETPLHMSASIGISLSPDDGTHPETLLKHADIAMYRAKDKGRNTFVFFSPDMNALASERLALENRLRGALERGEFTLEYQPQHDAHSGDIRCVEALLRWRDEDGEIASPAVFIPLLEETGLIREVGLWIIDEGCAQLARWHDAGHRELRLAINVSSQQVGTPGLPERIEDALRRSKLAPHFLELEITESLMVTNDRGTEDVLRRLVDLGVLLAVDDFGTGYSSLSYLHRLSIDTLKIDRAFVTRLPDNEDSMAIARAIVGLGQSLHLNLVAEGVETPEQHACMRELGCHLMQGYLFSRPVSAQTLGALLREHRDARRA